MRVLAAALTIGLSLICLIGTARAQVAGRLIDTATAGCTAGADLSRQEGVNVFRL